MDYFLELSKTKNREKQKAKTRKKKKMQVAGKETFIAREGRTNKKR